MKIRQIFYLVTFQTFLDVMYIFPKDFSTSSALRFLQRSSNGSGETRRKQEYSMQSSISRCLSNLPRNGALLNFSEPRQRLTADRLSTRRASYAIDVIDQGGYVRFLPSSRAPVITCEEIPSSCVKVPRRRGIDPRRRVPGSLNQSVNPLN